MFYSHNPRLSRSYKALCSATQFVVLAALTCAIETYSEPASSVIVRTSASIFGLMRLTQLLLGLGQVREESTSQLFIVGSTLLLVLINLVSQIVTYLTVLNSQRDAPMLGKIWL